MTQDTTNNIDAYLNDPTNGIIMVSTKNTTPAIAKITPHSKKTRTIDGANMENVDVMDSDDVSDKLDTPLTLKHCSNGDVIFNNNSGDNDDFSKMPQTIQRRTKTSINELFPP